MTVGEVELSHYITFRQSAGALRSLIESHTVSQSNAPRRPHKAGDFSPRRAQNKCNLMATLMSAYGMHDQNPSDGVMFKSVFTAHLTTKLHT